MTRYDEDLWVLREKERLALGVVRLVAVFRFFLSDLGGRYASSRFNIPHIGRGSVIAARAHQIPVICSFLTSLSGTLYIEENKYLFTVVIDPSLVSWMFACRRTGHPEVVA
jgi:hypothetical protein